MSKYIKQDDIFELVRTGVLVSNSNFESVCKHIGSLPAIEDSGDAISREHLKSFEYINKGDFNSVETIREWIDNAPSVILKER